MTYDAEKVRGKCAERSGPTGCRPIAHLSRGDRAGSFQALSRGYNLNALSALFAHWSTLMSTHKIYLEPTSLGDRGQRYRVTIAAPS